MEDQDNKSIVIDVSLPTGWHDLSEKQLKFAFSIIGRGESEAYLMTHCFLKWSGLKVEYHDNLTGVFQMKLGKRRFLVTALDMAQWMRPLAWLKSVPDFPVRIGRSGTRRALPADFQDVVFEKYLYASVVWNSFTASKSDDDLRNLCRILYGFRPQRLSHWMKANCIYWMSSLNKYLAVEFPNLFNPPKNSGGTGSLAKPSVMDSVKAMIRALTKGDVLKEKDILKIDCWTAFAELDAIAHESAMVKSAVKK